jgi:plastocyanin
MRLFHALTLAAALALAPGARASVIDVSIQFFQFTGQHLTIELGDTVRWTNLDSGTHTTTEGTDLIVNGNEAWHHVLPPGSQPFSVTFDAAFLAANPRLGNRYDYFCAIHTAMRGSITVVDGPGLPFCFCSPLGPCSNRDYGAGCTWVGNDRGGRLLASGSSSVAADDLVLRTDLLPPNRACLYFRGTSQLGQTPMGEGWRCIGGPLLRFGAQVSSPNGVLALGPGIVASTASSSAPILAGQTWYFQAWYRDPGGACGDSTNVSNGYELPFTP